MSRDADGDRRGDPEDCFYACDVLPRVGFVMNASDCNDGDRHVHPRAIEICDGIDNNCSGVVDEGCAEWGVGHPGTDPELAERCDHEGDEVRQGGWVAGARPMSHPGTCPEQVDGREAELEPAREGSSDTGAPAADTGT